MVPWPINSVLHKGLVPKLNLELLISITSWYLKGIYNYNQISIFEVSKILSLIKVISGIGGLISVSFVLGTKKRALVFKNGAGYGENPIFPKCQFT